LSWRIGIDIGGAFTDLLAVNDKTGEVIWVKVESTPPRFSKGVLEAVSKSGIDLSDAAYIVHGQTVVINTIITRSGAKTGLITTRGFDILDIGRANRRDLFNLKYRKPEPLVPRFLTIKVDERVLADGSVEKPINELQVRIGVRELVEKGVESFAVSFINSYANSVHEKRAKEIIIEELEKLGKPVYVTISSEITKEWREYERTVTAVLNAYTQPILHTYLSELEEAFKSRGFKGTFYVMTASAGTVTSGYAKNYPIFTVEGGPIAGIIGGINLGELLGEKNIIVLDGGSTTTKAGLVEGLKPKVTTEYYIERDRFRPGYPVRVPVVEIVEVGNGGTSIAWIDEFGNLKVGPKAAGAYPGPACYGKGGSEPTLTDAYVVNGYLNPKYLLGGELPIKRELAEKALNKLAEYYNIPVEEVADAIIRIANEQAAHVIRLVSVQKGYDPRNFVLIAHGGSGPMFAPFIAEDLNIPRIIVPAIPAGVFNAWGMLTTDLRHDIVYTHVMKLENTIECSEMLSKTYESLERDILETFMREGIEPEKVVVSRYADIRYYGQEWTIKIPIVSGKIGVKEVGVIWERFEEAHEREYGFRLPGNPVEIVNFHVIGLSKVKKYEFKPVKKLETTLSHAFLEERDVYFGKSKGYKLVPVYQKELLPVKAEIEGPCIIEEKTATLVVTEKFKAKTDEYLNVILVKK